MTYRDASQIKSVAVVGTGVMGAGWVAYFLAKGLKVVAHDPVPDAHERLQATVVAAFPAMRAAGITEMEAPDFIRLISARSPGDAAQGADFVQECVPEDRALKAAVLREIDAGAAPDVIIASSTSGIRPSELQTACRRPDRFVVAHPCNPPTLMPLVEVVGGQNTVPAAVEAALAFYRRVGKQPITLRREMVGHLANRLQGALLREAIYCLMEGVASPQDLDAALRFGPGLRWSFMGWLLNFHLVGGVGGIEVVLDHAAEHMNDWFDALGDIRITSEVRKRLAEAVGEVVGGTPIETWLEYRDAKLAGLLRFLDEPPRYGEPV